MMACKHSTHSGKTTMDNLTKETCSLYKPWVKSNGNCCPEGIPHAGYSKADQPVTICQNGQLKLACSLTDEPNIDYPTDGEDKTPPTWVVKSMDQHIKALSGPGPAGADGAKGDKGDKGDTGPAGADGKDFDITDKPICTDVDFGEPDLPFFEQCHDVPKLTEGCTIRKVGISTNAAGCTTLGWYTESSNQLVSGGSEAAPVGSTVRWPLDPTSHTANYDYLDLNADNAAGTINQAKLDQNGLMCFEVNVPCDDMELTLEIGATVVFDPANAGISRFVVSVDGVFPTKADGNVIAMNFFTSFEGSAQPVLNMTLPAGMHTLCVYLIGGSDTENLAQIVLRNTATEKRPVYILSKRIA